MKNLNLTASRQRWTLPVLLTATFMSTLDFFIINVALPSIQHDLHAGTAGIEWVVAGYGLAFGSNLVMGGRLGDHFGKRRLLKYGLLLFVLASIVCGLANSTGVLIGARIAQGLTAALMSPQVLGIITASFTGELRTTAIRMYGITLGLAAVLGQLIGGLLIQANIANLGWRACFLVNVPIGLVAAWLVSLVVEEVHIPHASKLDAMGAGLLALCLIGVIAPLTQGQSLGWPLWTWFSFALSMLLASAFVLWERRLTLKNRAPLVDITLFSERAFAVGLIAQLSFWLGIASFFLILAIYLQQGLHMTPLASGFIFTIFGAGYLFTSLYAHIFLAKLGRQAISLGAIAMTLGLGLLSAASRSSASHNVWLLLPGLAIEGAGMGIALTPLISTIVTQVQPHHAGAASGVLATTQQVGNALGVAMIGAIFYSLLGTHGSYQTAFSNSMLWLCLISVIVVLMSQLLPKKEIAK